MKPRRASWQRRLPRDVWKEHLLRYTVCLALGHKPRWKMYDTVCGRCYLTLETR